MYYASISIGCENWAERRKRKRIKRSYIYSRGRTWISAKRSETQALGRTCFRSPIRVVTVLLARVRRIGTTHRRLRDGTSDCDSSSPTTIASRARERRDGGWYIDSRAVLLRKIAGDGQRRYSRETKSRSECQDKEWRAVRSVT